MLRKRLNSMTPGRLIERVGRGFTLIEMMVAVGAVALVAVGLATIFDSVGKTVTGGRRVSVVNTYAALVESQLRRDFANMSRDGFLIIRNQWVDANNNGKFHSDGDKVQLTADEPIDLGRGRRIDEIQFVVTGKYSSSRQPMVPGVQAESNTAVVYLGHGVLTPELNSPELPGFKKSVPRVGDRNLQGLGKVAPLNNPNRYAANWMLLRHVTLLANQQTEQALPPGIGTAPVYGIDPTTPPGSPGYHRLRNRPTQYMLQPAASSLFRSVGAVFPPSNGQGPTPNQTLRALAISGDGYYPARSSGIVDIASTSLAEIQAVVNTCREDPSAISGAWPVAPNRTMTPVVATSSQTRSGDIIDRMHAWLNDLMPSESRNQYAAANHGDFPTNTGVSWGSRIRYEEGPTDLLAAIALNSPTPPTPAQLGVQAQRRADQLMLSSSNFVPHCTDFHVEWSFGLTDSYGQVVWHGLPTPRSIYTARHYPPPTGSAVVDEPLPYPWTSDRSSDGNNHPYVLQVGTGTVTHEVSQRLIYGFEPGVDDAVLTSYFGWIDPTYAPAGNIPIDELTSGVVPWAWPKLIRVTITMVDPVDPSIESTFQYIFDVPAKEGQRAQ